MSLPYSTCWSIHLFVPRFLVPVPLPVPDSRFWIPDFLLFHTPNSVRSYECVRIMFPPFRTKFSSIDGFYWSRRYQSMKISHRLQSIIINNNPLNIIDCSTNDLMGEYRFLLIDWFNQSLIRIDTHSPNRLNCYWLLLIFIDNQWLITQLFGVW